MCWTYHRFCLLESNVTCIHLNKLRQLLFHVASNNLKGPHPFTVEFLSTWKQAAREWMYSTWLLVSNIRSISAHSVYWFLLVRSSASGLLFIFPSILQILNQVFFSICYSVYLEIDVVWLKESKPPAKHFFVLTNNLGFLQLAVLCSFLSITSINQFNEWAEW